MLNRIRPVHLSAVLVALLVLSYAAWFSVHTLIAHARFHTYAYDLGTFDQGIWLAGHDPELFVTVRGLHLLGDHVRLVAFVLAPLYWIWDDVRALLILQSVAIAIGALFVWRIAAGGLPGRPWLAAVLAVSYLLHPAVQNLNLDHAHPDAFATTFILASIHFLRANRLVAFGVAAALAMSCKEDVPLVYVAMGAALVLDRCRRRTGLVLATAAGAYFALCMLVILPTFNGVGFFRFSSGGFFADFGRHGANPWWLVERLLRPESFEYLWSVGVPNLFLFLLAPLSVVPAVPALAANLLADASYPRSLEYHYQTSVLPFLYLGTIDALARLDALRRGEAVGPWWKALGGPGGSAPRGASTTGVAMQRPVPGIVGPLGAALPAALLVAALATNVAWSHAPIHRADRIVERWRMLRDDESNAKIHAALARIPANASVSAHFSLVPQLSHRRPIYMYPNPFRVAYWGIDGESTHDPDTVDYIVLRNQPRKPPITDEMEHMIALGTFEVVEGDRHYGVYRRRSAPVVGESASCGDWDGDGEVTREDLVSIATSLARGQDCPSHVCDTDGNLRVEHKDVVHLGRHLRDRSIPLGCPRLE